MTWFFSKSYGKAALYAGLAAAALGAATPQPAHAIGAELLLKRMMKGWEAELPAPGSGWQPGLTATGAPTHVANGAVAPGDLLFSVPVKHAATGEIVASKRLPERLTARWKALVGKPVFAVPMGPDNQAVWCRWEPNPRKAVIKHLDPVPTGACFPVVDGVAGSVAVFEPQGLYVTEIAWHAPAGVRAPGYLPGLGVELKDVEFGVPMRLEYVLKRAKGSEFAVGPYVRWQGGEAALAEQKLRLEPGGSAKVPLADAVLTLSRDVSGALHAVVTAANGR